MWGKGKGMQMQPAQQMMQMMQSMMNWGMDDSWDGMDGMDGMDGVDGMDGMDGFDGMDGMDGMDDGWEQPQAPKGKGKVVVPRVVPGKGKDQGAPQLVKPKGFPKGKGQQAGNDMMELTDGVADEGNVTEVLKFTVKSMLTIIGPGGKNINAVRAETGATVLMKKEGAACVVTCGGTRSQVNDAKERLQSMPEVELLPLEMQEQPVQQAPPAQQFTPADNSWDNSWQAEQPEEAMETMIYEIWAFGAIIGKQGANIKEIRSQTRAKLNLEKDAPEKGKVQVKIEGTPEQIQKAKAMVMELVDQEQKRKDEKAEREQQKQQDWGGGDGQDWKQWDNKKPGEDRYGKWNRGEREKKEHNDDDVFILELEKQKALKIIGQKGAMVKQIGRESSAFLKIELDSEPASIRVSGSVDSVDKARTMIYDILASDRIKPRPGDWEDQMFRKCSTEESRKIIGSKGSNIGYIEKKSWAKLQVDNEEGGAFSFVRITGSFEAVDIALTMISDVLNNKGDWAGYDSGGGGGGDGGRKRKRYEDGEEPEASEILHFEAQFSGNIIGKRGDNIKRARQESGADIECKKVENDTKAEVTIKGSADEVEAAKKIVHELVEEAQAKIKQREERQNWNRGGGYGNNNQWKIVAPGEQAAEPPSQPQWSEEAAQPQGMEEAAQLQWSEEAGESAAPTEGADQWSGGDMTGQWSEEPPAQDAASMEWDANLQLLAEQEEAAANEAAANAQWAGGDVAAAQTFPGDLNDLWSGGEATEDPWAAGGDGNEWGGFALG
mmetsp:Transcript_126969/g.232998  ORF Transcript_126969/g.232998 Transcript_126969/m.232998 type:complete len:776 (+) Transcript_126969:94-2421(+)